MKTHLSHTTLTVEQVIDRIFTSGKITRQDEKFLLSATVAQSPLSSEELSQMRRVLTHLRMGLIKVAD